MIATNEELALLEKWKRKLCLQEWRIKLLTHLHPEERLGYYVPYEKRTKENDWYGKDMVLDNEQAKQLADYAVKKEVYNWDGVESVVAEALAHGNKVVINADW